MTDQRKKNRRVALFAAVFAVGMVGMAFAAVPLYRIFCQVTGFGGTPQTAQSVQSDVIERQFTIRFNADHAGDLPWTFEPAQRAVTVRAGESGLAFYRAGNNSEEPVTGMAVYNVSPPRVGRYFVKVDCFCFNEQTLQPGQVVDMPVTFYIDPAIDDDPNMTDIETITLSYTFYRKEGAAPGPVSLLNDEDQSDLR